MKKRTKKLQFSQKDRKKIKLRDRDKCIFCERNFFMHSNQWWDYETKEIMHYIPRSQGGLGIEQNGAVGCHYHHDLMDNGNKGLRKEMLGIMKQYLRSKYLDWDEGRLTYQKYSS